VRIFYPCYDDQKPTGGQKHTYQHVDILNEHGLDAFVVHTAPGFRLTWFENRTRVISHAEFEAIHDPRGDYVVLPETMGSTMLRYPGRKVIFNKNLFQGFLAFNHDLAPGDPYHHPEVVAALTVSEHNAAHLRFAYPSLPVWRVYSGIDTRRFAFHSIRGKKKQIVTPNKTLAHVATLFHLLRARADAGLNALAGYSWVVLKGQSEEEIAAMLRESLIFVFFSIEEGLSRVLLEAMACGCLIVTHWEGPSAECLPEQVAAASYGDLITAARHVEAIARTFETDPASLDARSAAGRSMAERFSLERQAVSVMDAWQQILRSGG